MPAEGDFRPELAFEKVFDYPEDYICAKTPAEFRLRIERQLYRAAVFFGENGAVWDMFEGWSKRPYALEEQRRQELKKILVLEYAIARYLERNAATNRPDTAPEFAALQSLWEKIRGIRKNLEAPPPPPPPPAKAPAPSPKPSPAPVPKPPQA